MMLENSQIGPMVVSAVAAQDVHGSDLREFWRVLLDTWSGSGEVRTDSGTELLEQVAAALSEAGFSAFAGSFTESLLGYSGWLAEFGSDVRREWGDDLVRAGEDLSAECERYRHEWAQQPEPGDADQDAALAQLQAELAEFDSWRT